ncbi:hypothetical protein PAMP_004843 [Pampus punctatissimus]
MLGGIHTDLLVAVTLLFLTQTGTQCRAENDMLLVTLPDWKKNSEYVTKCFYDRHNNLICDWTRIHQRTDGVPVNILESGALDQGEACLEFWYLVPVGANGSELRALLNSSTGLVEIWTSPALPRSSWRQVFVPLNIIESGTQVVLEAIQAESMEGQVIFNWIGVRRGSCGHQCESNTELWTDESTRCLCSAGQLYCSPSQCPERQICGPQKGSSSGISATGMCTIHSGTDCSTFDGVLFRFMGPCTYVLAKTCSPTETLPMFRVEVVNENNGNSSLPTVQQVIVEMANFRVSLLKRQTHRVVVNGIWRKLPLSLSSGTVNIKSNTAAVLLRTSFGLSVSFDNAGAVHIILPSTYSDKVCGLCGNFNNLRGDDFRKPNGTDAHDATDLAKSWHAKETTSSCETILLPHQCDPLEKAEYASELYCGGLLSSTGPFAACLSALGAESYFRACVAGMCSSHGDPGVLCDTLQVYTGICQEAGIAVQIWRNSTFCPLQCGENSHFNSCTEGCPDVCSSLDFTGSCVNCEERCECDFGFKLSGGKCVPAEDCGCWYNGTHYEKGETFLEKECMQQCQCMGSDNVQCTPMQCADNEVCKVKDGVKGCFPFKPVTCNIYGDPHFITFDGLAYDFQGGCIYTLTTTCGSESSVHFTVTGHNMHPALQNFTQSKLEAVALQVEDLYLTMNQSGEVYVDSSPVQLPYSSNASYGSVWVYMRNSYIILETTFGLRMMIDRQHRLFLQVDERYMYELCGLCGTYSKQQDDDFVKPGGQNTTDPFEFGDSWRVPDNNECIAYPNDPRLCDYDEENEAYNECYTLLGEAFGKCHEPIHPSIYLNSCVYDYCATSGDQHTLCESLTSYAAACQVAGVELGNWQTNTACTEPPTTATLPTTSTPSSPTPDQTFCPMNCDFEKNLCGWEQLVQDSFEWTRHSGPTPSDLSGPNQDHTTGAGFYIYIEGNSVTHGDSARLLSSWCHYNGPLCLHFWYHMYGSATAMTLNIYLLKDNKVTKLWSMINDQGPEWHPGNVNIRNSGPFQIIIEGIRGSNDLSDVAIDDISINFGSCSGSFPGMVSGTKIPPTTAVLPSLPVCNLNCSFDSNLCSWDQMITDAFDWTWQSGSTPTLMTGPSADHTGDGHYLYIEASSVTHGDTARLTSSECSEPGPQCLQFWYHMYGSADTMGLHVYLLQDRNADAIWWKRNNHGNMWHMAQVDFTTIGSFQIIIEGRRGFNEESDVAIDDVQLYHSQCSDLSAVILPKPDGNTTAPPSVSVPTTAAPEPPEVNGTAQPLLANVTIPPIVEATTNLIDEDNVTEAPDNRPPPHPTQPLTSTTPKPQPPSTARPLTMTTTGPQTTFRTSSLTTEQPIVEPEFETTEGSQNTARPEQLTTLTEEAETTVRCQPTTKSDEPTVGPQLQTAAKSWTLNETQSKPQTTARPQPSTITQPQPETTFNEEWYTNHCSQKCECEKHNDMGKIDCDDKDECDGNAVCLRNEEGHYYCQSTGFDECTIKGDPEYRTFDNLKHDFDGEHSYVLVRTNNLPNNFPDVYIEGINAQIVDDEDDSQQRDNHSSDEDHSRSVRDDEDDDNDDKHDHDSEEHKEHHALQELKIRVYNYTVEFKKNRKLVLDGRRTKTPASPTAGLNIQEHSSRIYLKTDFGLSVEFDGHSRAEIILPRIYRRKVGGLCGNFDGRRRNDWMKPDGTMARTVQEFGESWRAVQVHQYCAALVKTLHVKGCVTVTRPVSHSTIAVLTTGLSAHNQMAAYLEFPPKKQIPAPSPTLTKFLSHTLLHNCKGCTLTIRHNNPT